MSDCPTDNEFDGRMGIRISAIFVILVGSFLGTWFPVFAARNPGVGVPSWAFSLRNTLDLVSFWRRLSSTYVISSNHAGVGTQ